MLPLLVVWILAPPLLGLALGGQLMYASYQMRRRRLADKTDVLLRTHLAFDVARPA
jgi:hypothetical protein